MQQIWTREFRLFYSARTVSMVGGSMMPVAAALGMYSAGYGATGVGLALAAWMAPMAGLILFGGVFTDRFTPRRMMIGADVVRTVTQLLMALIFVLGQPALWQVLVLSAIAGGATAMYLPGVAGTIPRITGDVQRANALLRVSEAIMQLIGPGLAGLVVGFAGVSVVFMVDAAGFAISGLCLMAMRRLPAIPGAADEPMLSRLKGGWHEFRSRTWLWGVILIWIVFGITLFGPIIPIGSILVTEGHGLTAYGLVMSAGGAGTIVGGLLAMRIRPVRPLAAGAVGIFLYALEPLTIALQLPLPGIMAGHVLGGAGMAFWSVMWATSIQTTIPADALNRVTAYEVGGSSIAVPIGQALAGPVALLVGGRELLAFSAVVAVLGSLTLLLVPAIRKFTAGQQLASVTELETAQVR